jgi:DNA-binding transcriptional LysR family regulator
MEIKLLKNKISLDDLFTFIKAVEIGSYVLAAKYFAVNSATISRRISNLELSLGQVKLVEKTNNSFYPTELGKQLIALVLSDANCDFNRLLHSLQNLPTTDRLLKKNLLLVIPPIIGLLTVTKYLHKFFLANPNINLNICYQNKEPDLVADNVDIAIVLYSPGKRLNQKFKRIGVLSSKLFCTQQYINKYGIPKTPHELIQHNFVGLISDDFNILKKIKFTHVKTGEILEVGMPNRITTNSTLNNAELINSGEVIAGVLDIPFILSRYNNFIEVLPEYTPEQFPIYLLKHPYREDKYIDLCASFLEECISDGFWGNRLFT